MMLNKNKTIARVLGVLPKNVSRTYMNKTDNKAIAIDMGVYCIDNDISKEDLKTIVDAFVNTRNFFRSKI